MPERKKAGSTIEPKTIAILPGEREDRRIRVTLMPSGAGLQLTHETFSDDIGWFSQSHVDLSPNQVADLRETLGVTQTARPIRAHNQAGSFSVYRAG